MQTPLISVVVPMYNAEKFIRKCMEHLIHQTYKNIEIIVVNDGSTDKCGDIIKNYAKNDKRVKLINQKNAGVSVASNVGIDAASGEYVHIHDHDDFVNLDYFEKMANAAALTDADILCGEVNEIGYSFPKFDAIEVCISLEDKIKKTHANKFNPAWRYVYKTDFLRRTKLQFEPSVWGAQDILFSKPAIILADTVALVPGAIYNVIDKPTSLGKDKKKQRATTTAETEQAWKRYAEFLDAHGATDLIYAPDTPMVRDRFTVFKITLFHRDIYSRKIKYYLFGINIGTRRLD